MSEWRVNRRMAETTWGVGGRGEGGLVSPRTRGRVSKPFETKLNTICYQFWAFSARREIQLNDHRRQEGEESRKRETERDSGGGGVGEVRREKRANGSYDNKVSIS